MYKMNIKIVRLKSGEELVGSVIKETNDVVVIQNTCIVLPTSESGQIGLYKFMPYGEIEDGLELKKSDTYFIVTPKPDLSDYYESLVESSSEIVTNQEKEIIT